MQIPLNIEVIILGAIIAQGCFAGGLLFFSNTNRSANRILAVLLLLFSLWLCDTFFRVSEIYNQNPNFYFLPIYFSLAFGPLIYFYTKALTEKHFRLTSKHLLHFIPALLHFFFYCFLQLNDYAFRRWFWIDIHQPYTYDLEFVLSLFSLLIYLALSLKVVQAYHKWIDNNYSDISQIKINWLRYTHLLLLLLTVFWIADAYVRLLVNYYPEKPLSTISIGFFVLFLAIGALRQKELKEVGKEQEMVTNNPPEALEPLLLVRIKDAMEEDKLYLRHELNLKEFAQKLGVPSRKVSKHINGGLHLSFIDFVNTYRVEAVKKQLEDGSAQHLSLFGLAMECGFNSKPTFHRVFKKFTGKSPSEYQKMAQNKY